MVDLPTLKARVDLRSLIQETHPVVKGLKIHCLWHDDRTPSLHIYPDGYFCFVCGASGDHLDWLMATRALSFSESIDVLARQANVPAYYPSIQATSLSVPKAIKVHEPCLEKPTFERRLPLKQHQLETHKRRAARLTEIPKALEGRGFTLADCQRLDIVDENGNAIFPVTGPSWVLALKCRYAVPDPHRYEYTTPGRGTPAWCSPDLQRAKIILVIEGELNGMICWLACQEKQIGVMGAAGTNGPLYLDVMNEKTVYLYADDDEAGHEAKQRWAKQALGSGAKDVFLLEPWPVDACDIAGAFGKVGLRKRLTWTEKTHFTPGEPIDAVHLPSATHGAANGRPSPTPNSDLMQWCSQLRLLPSIGSAIPQLQTSTLQPAYHDVA